MFIFNKVLLFFFITFHIYSTTARAALILPEPDCGLSSGKTCLVYDDFTVFSMSFLQFTENGSLSPNSGDKYYINSSPGHLADDIVIASSPHVSKDNEDLTPSLVDMDNAFDTPNAGGSETFVMLSSNEPSPVLTNDNFINSALPNPDNLDIDNDGIPDGDANGNGISLWDIETASLTSFLGGDDLLFFFNLNETGANDTLDSGQDMLSWMRVFLTDSTTGDVKHFTLSGNNTLAPAIQSRAQSSSDSILPTEDDMWAYTHGEICVSTVDGTVLALSSCSFVGNPANGVTVNQNLGANAAAFALWNEELNDDLYSGKYDMLSVDMRMSHIENGYEQLFIRAANVSDGTVIINEVPSPSSLFLIFVGPIVLLLKCKKPHIK